jgi:anhydro-N-acetylmuramic acid kinase
MSKIGKHPFNMIDSLNVGVSAALLIHQINNAFPSINFKTTDSLGINPDAKEAVLFAILANECVAADEQIDFGPQHGVPSISMGKICIP